MKKIMTLAILAMVHNTLPAAEPEVPMFPRVEVRTSEGAFVLELDGRRAPVSVVNFVEYVRSGFYDGTVFHRVMPGFVAQAGGFDVDLEEKQTRPPVVNESGNGLSNLRGTIAMARTADPHSATAQFYINLADNRNLDPSPSRWGYCVFGQVVEGLEVLDKIAEIPTGAAGPFRGDVPQRNVIIESTRLIDETAPDPQ